MSACLTALGGCSNPAGGPGDAGKDELSGSIQISGSSTVAPVTEVAFEEFSNEHGDVKIEMAVTGTSAGMSRFLKKEIDVCNASRPMKDDEKAKAKDAGIEFIELTVAFDGLAVVASPENDWCDSLTVEQLKTIWEPAADGVITKWSQIDESWPDVEFKLYGPGTASGTFDYFTEAIVGEEDASRTDYQMSEDDNMLVRGVTGDRGALGYFGYAYYAENEGKLKLLGVDAGDGPVKPSMETVLDGSYTPLARPLYIYVNTASLARPAVAEFVGFYIDNAGEFAKARGYVPVPEDVAAENTQRLEQALEAAR